MYYFEQLILKCLFTLFIKIYLCYKGLSIYLLCKNAIGILMLFCLYFFNICFLIFCHLVPPFDLHKKKISCD